MPKYYIIGWRPTGKTPFFFRGDNRWEIYLPFTDISGPHKGWTINIEYARVFSTFPDFGPKSVSKGLDVIQLKVYSYDRELLPTQMLRPTKRPRY